MVELNPRRYLSYVLPVVRSRSEVDYHPIVWQKGLLVQYGLLHFGQVLYGFSPSLRGRGWLMVFLGAWELWWFLAWELSQRKNRSPGVGSTP